MFESISNVVATPMFSVSVAVGAACIAASAAIVAPIALSALRRRLDAIDEAQAEIAAFVASETRRISNLISEQRAEAIGDSLRRSSRRRPPVEAAPERRRPNEQLQQPLRKTIH